MRNPQALDTQAREQAYFRLIKNLCVGDVKEILLRMADDLDILEQLKEDASQGPLRSREHIGMVFVEAAEEYCREMAGEVSDGKDLIDGHDRRS